jgi:tetratricopeptide (TPR) repeat protein
LKEAPEDTQALRLAARAAAHRDQDQTAIALFRRLAEGNKDAEDFSLLGRALNRVGQPYEAFLAYEAARSINPDYGPALAAATALLMQSDRYEGAAETALRLASQPEWEARAQLMLGTARSEINDHAGAAKALSRWAQLDPDGSVVAPYPAVSLKKRLARSWLRCGRPAAASKILQEILAAGPDPEASWLLSRCYIQQRDWKQAAAVLEHSPTYRSDDPLEVEPAPYVGETKCAECHRAEYDAAVASRHATTLTRSGQLGSIPLLEAALRDPGNPEVSHQFRREGDSLMVETRWKQKVLRAVIDYAFGSLDHFSTFIGRDDQHRSFMIRMSFYRSPKGSGWDVATGLTPQPADEEEYLGKKMLAGDGVRRCVSCHTTNAYSILHEPGPESHDRSIGCERCHGPGGHHIAAVAAEFADTAIDGPAKAAPDAVDQMCAKCHSIHQPDNLDLPRTDPLWLRFQSLTLSWSRCYTESEGKLGCLTCHDPHRNTETNTTRNEAKCLECHASERKRAKADSSTSRTSTKYTDPAQGSEDTAGISKPCPVNPTRGCIDCHLPRIWVQSTHSFKSDHYIRIREQGPTNGLSTPAAGRTGHE